MTVIDWADPEFRAEALRRLGPTRYRAAAVAVANRSIVATINGHIVRRVKTQYGDLFAVGTTGRAFVRLAKAAEFARGRKA